MVAGVLICLLLCHQKRPEKQSHGLPWQLSMAAPSVLLSLPHTSQENRPHPVILLAASHHKNTSLLLTTGISLLILNKSQPHINLPI